MDQVKGILDRFRIERTPTLGIISDYESGELTIFHPTNKKYNKDQVEKFLR